MTHLIGYTQNDLPVYVDLFTSKAAKHIAREPHMLTLAAEALRLTTLEMPTIDLEYDMGRTVGYDFVVKTTDVDLIFYVQLLQDSVYTRFTRNGKPLPTSHISVSLRQNQGDASYWLDDIRIGHLIPPRPGSIEETTKSKPYWESHAFVFGHQPMQSATLTKTRPY